MGPLFLHIGTALGSLKAMHRHVAFPLHKVNILYIQGCIHCLATKSIQRITNLFLDINVLLSLKNLLACSKSEEGKMVILVFGRERK